MLPWSTRPAPTFLATAAATCVRRLAGTALCAYTPCPYRRSAPRAASFRTSTAGTPYEIDTRYAILFLEETRDPMSFVDERLVHLRAAGLLRHVRGIVFGQLSLDRSEEDEFEDFLLDLVSDLKVPILMDFPAGHEVPNLTLPLGTDVELVADETTGWIVYREDALIPADAPVPAQVPVPTA